jgi:flagellar biosynthesis/type III secretory pathway protein FliH
MIFFRYERKGKKERTSRREEWRKEGTKEWRKEGTKEGRKEGTKEWRKEGIKRDKAMGREEKIYITRNRNGERYAKKRKK